MGKMSHSSRNSGQTENSNPGLPGVSLIDSPENRPSHDRPLFSDVDSEENNPDDPNNPDSLDEFNTELLLDDKIPKPGEGRTADANVSGDEFVTIDIHDDSIIPHDTPPISHYVFLVLLFRSQRVVVAFCKWCGKRIFTENSFACFNWLAAKASILVYYNPETGQKREVDMVFDIPTINNEFEFRLKMLLEHKSYPDDEEPLQSTGYVNLMYRKQAAEQKGTRIAQGAKPGTRCPIELDPVVRVKLYHGESEDMGITRFEEYFRHIPQEIFNDLKPYVGMNDPLDINLRTMPPEDFPSSPDVPELYFGLKTMRDVFCKDLDRLLDENIQWLVSQVDKFDSSRDFYELGNLVIRYLDHYPKNLGEGHLDKIDKTIRTKTGDNSMPSVLQGYLERGRQEGRQEGIVLCLRELILQNLEERFGRIPEEVVEEINSRTDSIALKSLLASINGCRYLDDFREQL